MDGATVVAEGKDLRALQESLAQPVQAAIASAAGDLEVTGLTAWTVGDIPAEVTSGPVVGYPALVDEGSSVALRVLPQPSPATHHAGVRRLLLLNTSSPVKAVSGKLSNAAKLALARNPHGSLTALIEDCLTAAVDTLVPCDARTRAAFDEQLAVVREGIVDALLRVLKDVEKVLAVAPANLPGPAGADLAAQRERLVHKGFVTEHGAARLPDIARYLQAAAVRAEKRSPRDAELMGDVHVVQQEWAKLPPGPDRERIGWMLEELRVSLLAPSIKAKGPVSVQRLWRALDELQP
jgi:ATP-dependent helicase HrpA